MGRERASGQFARFVVVGVTNTVVDLVIFYLLKMVMPELGAKAISYALGICNSFLWNKYWTFGAGRSGKGGREFARFFLVNTPPLAVNLVVFTVLGIWAGSSSLAVSMAKAFAAAVVTVVWNFVGSRYWAFRHTALQKSQDD